MSSSSSSPHVLAVPLPAQGHVIPLMELSHRLVEHGFRVTFVNTEFNHARVVAASSGVAAAAAAAAAAAGIDMVSVPDGLDPGEDRNNLGKLFDGLLRTMPSSLEELIRKIESEGSKISCVIADENMGFTLRVAEKMSLRAVCFWTASAAMLATMVRIPKMIEDGVLDVHGLPRKNDEFQLSEGMPTHKTTEFAWNCAGDSEGQKIIFKLVTDNNRLLELADFIICNTFHELESSVFAISPNILPVGPLLSPEDSNKPLGHFWSRDTTCLEWLDKQPADSVVYVAFGSFTVFDKRQFQELALGLELSSRPFLWVVRPDLSNEASLAWLESFQERTGGQGKMVSWSPQQQVLGHPSIACFLSHCGWNSTLEGVWNGLPFLCWPYFTDQFLNRAYICDVWKTGLSLSPDEGETISRKQIKEKLDQLLGDERMKARAMALKNEARGSVVEGGYSHNNLKLIIEAIKRGSIVN